MGRHNEWRKIAKRERRRKIRIQQSVERNKATYVDKESTEYKQWLQEEEKLLKFEYEQIEKCNSEENLKWIKAEELAIYNWNLLQEKKKQLQELHLLCETKRKQEWEMEQKRKKEEEQKLRQIEEEKKARQAMFMSKLEQFLSGNSIDPPAELVLSRQSRPGTVPCPFFNKTACCRFGDQCSRNHEYPGISTVLLAKNFFVHFGLNNTNPNEYDTDLMLEYEDGDTYKEFIEFFKDVFTEFDKFGEITHFKVCKNYEKHLRGNTYIEYAELRCAVAAYRALHSRWYGGKQLSLQFCRIDSWKRAICGLASSRKCPKGHGCNFLHVFKNPNDLCVGRVDRRTESIRSNNPTPSRNWRWSESPEKETPRRRRSRSPERKHRQDDKKYHKNHSVRESRRRSSTENKKI